jgi:hypothetical protein
MVSQTDISERRACSLVGLNRATMRYRTQSSEETELTEGISLLSGCRTVCKHRKGIMVGRQPLLLPEMPNHLWSMDFVMDSLANGRRIKCLTILAAKRKVSASTQFIALNALLFIKNKVLGEELEPLRHFHKSNRQPEQI